MAILKLACGKEYSFKKTVSFGKNGEVLLDGKNLQDIDLKNKSCKCGNKKKCT